MRRNTCALIAVMMMWPALVVAQENDGLLDLISPEDAFEPTNSDDYPIELESERPPTDPTNVDAEAGPDNAGACADYIPVRCAGQDLRGFERAISTRECLMACRQ